MKIARNVGNLDRLLRVLVGMALLLVPPRGLVGPEAWWTPFTLAGLALVATGVLGFCITYKLLGITTRKQRAEGEGGG